MLARRAGSIRRADSVASWLHGVALRVAMRAREGAARRRLHERKAAATRPLATLHGNSGTESWPELHEEIARLPWRYREPVVLCYLEGLTTEEAAARMGRPHGTVLSRLSRARRRLHDRLTRRGLTDTGAVPAIARLSGILPVVVPDELTASAVRIALRWRTTCARGAGSIPAAVASLAFSSERSGLAMMTVRVLTASLFLGLTIGTTVLAIPLLRSHEPHRPDADPVASQTEPPVPQAPPRETKVSVPEPGDRASTLAISPDGKTLVAACTDGSVKLLDLRTGEELAAWRGDQGGRVIAAGFTPDGKSVASAIEPNRVSLREAATGKLIKEFPALGASGQAGVPQLLLGSLAISPDGRRVAVAGGGTTDEKNIIRLDDTSLYEIRVFDVETGALEWSHLGRRGYTGQLLFSPDGTTLASAVHAHVQLWDSRSGELKRTLKPELGTVWSISFSPDGRHLAARGTARAEGRVEARLTLWDANSGRILRTMNAGPAGGVVDPGTLAFSPDGKTLACPGNGVREGRISIGGKEVGVGKKVVNYLQLWDVATGTLVWTSAEGDYGSVTSLVFSPDGESIYCCDLSATTRVDAGTGQIRKDLMRAKH